MTKRIRIARFAVLAGAVAVLGGCAAKVTRKDFDAEMVKVRDEIRSGDEQLGSRIDANTAKINEHDQRMVALERDLQAFRSEYNASIERLQSALKFNVPVHFDFASAELREADRPLLDRFASVVKEHYPNATITVEGFADPAGSTAFNKRLGQQRAETVRDYLATNGLGGDQLRAVSYGESRERLVVPNAKGPGEAGLENRRVALVIDFSQAREEMASY